MFEGESTQSTPPSEGVPVPPPAEVAAAAVPAAPEERVALGLLASLVAVVVGTVLTVLLWRAGFIASITSFVIAAGAVYLYSRAAGAPPRKGLVPVILLVALGVVASFFAVVASDLIDAYDQLGLGASGVAKSAFVRENLFNGALLADYGKEMAMFAVFAVLGVFGTVRRLLSAR